MDAPIVRVDRTAFKAAFQKAVAKVVDLYVDDMFGGVDVQVQYATRGSSTRAEITRVNNRLTGLSDADKMLTEFFNENANEMFKDLFTDEPLEPYVNDIATLLQ